MGFRPFGIYSLRFWVLGSVGFVVGDKFPTDDFQVAGSGHEAQTV